MYEWRVKRELFEAESAQAVAVVEWSVVAASGVVIEAVLVFEIECFVPEIK